MAAGTAGRRIVDVHHHLCAPGYVDHVKRKMNLRPYSERVLRNGTPAKSLEDMDRAGVATSMISLTTPGVWFGDAAEARRLAREANEHFARWVADHPGRYGMFAVLPLPDIDGALKEIEYALDTLKADGIGFYTSYGDKHLGDPQFAPVLEELNRRKALAYTHPVCADCCTHLLPGITEAAIEFGTDTTRTITSILFSGAATRYPHIKWLWSHAGGTMPFLIGRFLKMEKQPPFAPHLPNGVLPLLRKFHYDVAQTAYRGPLLALLQVVPVSQILFGTDFPYDTAVQQVATLAACGLSAAELAAIESGNAPALLPRCAVPA